MKKPKIGVTPLWDHKKQSLWMLPGYMDCIEQAGGLPYMLPLTVDEENIKQISLDMDGFLFTGGHDVSPALYGQDIHPKCGHASEARDEMERVLFREAVQMLSRPALGICRGLQLFNVILRGTLYQDISSLVETKISHRQSPPYDAPAHTVQIAEGTPLAEIGGTSARVNSYHHQAIDTLSPRLQAMATAPDGLVEAAFMPDKPFVWGVQWHPEYAPKDPLNMAIFSQFVAACEDRGA